MSRWFFYEFRTAPRLQNQETKLDEKLDLKVSYGHQQKLVDMPVIQVHKV